MENITNIFIPNTFTGVKSDYELLNEFGLYVNNDIIKIIWVLIITYILLEILYYVSIIFKIKILENTYNNFKDTYYNILIIPFMLLLYYLLSFENLINSSLIRILKFIFWFLLLLISIIIYNKHKIFIHKIVLEKIKNINNDNK